MYDGKCMAQHHYEASWWDVKVGNTSYKYEVLKDYFRENGTNHEILSFQIAALRQEIKELRESTSWRVTKPIRYFGDILKRKWRR